MHAMQIRFVTGADRDPGPAQELVPTDESKLLPYEECLPVGVKKKKYRLSQKQSFQRRHCQRLRKPAMCTGHFRFTVTAYLSRVRIVSKKLSY